MNRKLLIAGLAGAVALGAGARIYGRVTYGNPGTAGTIPIILRPHFHSYSFFFDITLAKMLKNRSEAHVERHGNAV